MICNGIDTDLLAALGEAVVTHPDAGNVTAGVRTRWEDRYRTRASTETFQLGDQPIPRETSVSADLPAMFGGTDRGPTPGELVLAALGSCVTQALVESAALRGVSIDRLEIVAEGHLDLRGSAGVDGVRPGMTRIHLDVEVETGADGDLVDTLLTEAVGRSPVADSLSAGVAVTAGVRQLRPA